MFPLFFNPDTLTPPYAPTEQIRFVKSEITDQSIQFEIAQARKDNFTIPQLAQEFCHSQTVDSFGRPVEGNRVIGVNEGKDKDLIICNKTGAVTKATACDAFGRQLNTQGDICYPRQNLVPSDIKIHKI